MERGELARGILLGECLGFQARRQLLEHTTRAFDVKLFVLLHLFIGFRPVAFLPLEETTDRRAGPRAGQRRIFQPAQHVQTPQRRGRPGNAPALARDIFQEPMNDLIGRHPIEACPVERVAGTGRIARHKIECQRPAFPAELNPLAHEATIRETINVIVYRAPLRIQHLQRIAHGPRVAAADFADHELAVFCSGFDRTLADHPEAALARDIAVRSPLPFAPPRLERFVCPPIERTVIVTRLRLKRKAAVPDNILIAQTQKRF